MRRWCWAIAVAGVGSLVLGSCTGPAKNEGAARTGASTVPLPAASAASPADYPGLHNVVSYGPDVVSGSVPYGAEGFDTLRGMGVKTIISVDGAAPDVAAAKARGIRYIHLPIGYNGMDHERTMEIARAVKEAEASGPVYIHCHHGKHRSAGAAGAAAVTLGLMTPEEAKARLQVSGTAPNYTGLFRCVEVAHVASAAELEAVGDDFPEVQPPRGIVHTMVEVDEVTDHLKAIEKAGWMVPKDHPDLVPVAEAGRLSDLFRTLGEHESMSSKPEEFRGWLADASRKAAEIEESLAHGGGSPADLSARFKVLSQSCTACHAKYRD